ncbi:hypothetical protein VAB18032_04080 [Micromonospora maris AB-18-032]|nr:MULTISPECIES: hypothetical protein [Micromonospora]AEB47898.1 hypothetical protein VAB18032_04080 [Micromonospora maris AB-18-032]
MPPSPLRRAAAGRRPARPDPRPRVGWAAGVLALTGLLLSGCGEPPEVRDGGTSGLPTTTATPSPSGPVTPSPSVAVPPVAGTAVPTTDAGLVATACRGEPSGQGVVNLVRGRSGLLPRNAKVKVSEGPLCAADWHFTALDVTGYEPLHVVTRRQAGALRLVTAGTDVCSVEVRVTAPPGVRRLACGDDAPVTVPLPTQFPTTPTPLPTTPAATPSTTTPGPGA